MLKSKLGVGLALFLIIFLGAAVRFYNLGKVPAGLYVDEAGQGYAAYSILRTGKDEFGKVFPFVFRSFTDFKTPVYIYLVVPLIPVFGLTAFTVRFPSFIFSVLTFPLLFVLIRRLAPGEYGVSLGVLVTFLLAISPWHTLFGRTNFECNVALFFYLLGVYLFYVGMRRPWVLVASALVLGIGFLAYHSERVIVPLTVIFLVWHFRRTVFERGFRVPVLAAVLVGVMVVLPTLTVVTTRGFLARANALNIISGSRDPAGYIKQAPLVVGSVVNSPIFLRLREFLSLYISYFSPRYMFDLGDYGPRSSFPGLATFYVWQFPFYVAGVYCLIRRRELGELLNFVIFLLVVAPVPAALTRDPYTTIRALPLVVPQLAVIGLGMVWFISILRGRWRGAGVVGLGVLSLYSLINLYNSAFILNEYYRAREWDFGYDQVVSAIQSTDVALPVVVDSARDEVYIELLFFLRFDPEQYQKDNFEVVLSEYYTNLSRARVRRIGRITTRPIEWERDLSVDQILVGDELAISEGQMQRHNLSLIKEIRYPDRTVAFRVVRTNPGE